jgi:hypothetical protein
MLEAPIRLRMRASSVMRNLPSSDRADLVFGS